MSDKQQLQKAVDELTKAKQEAEESVNKAAEKADRTRQEQTG
ncbi:hypothetical protein ES703_28833 [subsurface metagenome]